MEVALQNVKSEPHGELIIPDLEPARVNSSGNSKQNGSHPSKPRNPSSSLSTHKISTIQSTTSSVIQSPSSVIQSAGILPNKVIFVSSKPNSSVIQTTGGNLQGIQVLDTHSDESLSNDGVDPPPDNRTADKRRREILTRRPSYRKILSDLGGTEISTDKGDSATTSESSQDGSIVLQGQYPSVKVINANALGLGQATTADGSSPSALQTITMTNAGTAGGTIVQYAQAQDGQQFFVPVGSGEIQAYTIRPVSSGGSSPGVVMGGSLGHTGEGEVTKKREIRLLKNREAARECRRKKKEYIKCLENRVAVLENQNKALIDELKSLKELYCQQKND